MLGAGKPVGVPGVHGVSRTLTTPGELQGFGTGISAVVILLHFPQVPPLLELCCGFHYLRVKNAVGLAEYAAIPRQTNSVQGKVKFPITVFP